MDPPRALRNGLLLTFAACRAWAAGGPAPPEHGALCVGPAPAADTTVSLNPGPELRASTTASVGLGGLELGVERLLTVRGEEKTAAAIRFEFAWFENPFLCLSFDPASGAWSLREMSKSVGLCRCKGGASPGPDLPGWPTAQARYEAGVDLYAAGRLKEAVQAFKAVLDIEPDSASAKRAIRRVREELARDAQAASGTAGTP